ncbi:phage tail sheath protein [Leptospira sp. 96542]|nr:phage tail sheath protein [Leptospira sp. 96542]
MSLDTYHHGVRTIEVNEGARPIRTIATSVFGMVCIANDANAAKFPLNTPVLVTDVYGALADAGENGTLARSLEAISNQARPVGVVVRVAAGEGEGAEAIAAATNNNVIGTVTEGGQRTGLQALLSAQAMLGVKPRVLGVPGLDTQPVTTALAVVAQKLRAFAYAGVDDNVKVADVLDYRENFSARELMLIHPSFQSWSVADSATITVPAVAHALGLRAKIDAEQGWHKTISNVAVSGVTGISAPIFWDLQSSETDAGLLNEAGVTTLINSQGFKFWGSRTCSDDPLFEFESATRTGQIIADTIAEAFMWVSDKPLHPSIAKDILEGVNAKLRSWTSQGYIIGGSAWFDEQINTVDRLKAGKLAIDYDYTSAAPLEDLSFRQRITDRYYADFAQRVAA